MGEGAVADIALERARVQAQHPPDVTGARVEIRDQAAEQRNGGGGALKRIPEPF